MNIPPASKPVTRPLRLTDNRVPVYYAGGEQINEFRGLRGVLGPEDWVGSTCRLPAAILPGDAPPHTGVSRTADGFLDDLITQAPQAWLGAQLHTALGANPGVLVKLLDAGERLPVHCHPSRPFARQHLGSAFGKTEGWIVMRARPGAKVWLGMRDSVDPGQFRRWIDTGDSPAMLAAMNEVPAQAGQVFYVPASMPHAIGAGIMVTELQEPVTLSVTADYRPYDMAESFATLGLGWDTALPCFDLTAVDVGAAGLLPEPRPVHAGSTDLVNLFPATADPFFRAWRVSTSTSVRLPDPTFCVLIVNDGDGQLRWADDQTLTLKRGDTLVCPHSAGRLSFDGHLDVTVCLPPLV